MWLSDTSVKRPVFATVIALTLVAFGILSFSILPLRGVPGHHAPGGCRSARPTRVLRQRSSSRASPTVIEDQISGIEGVKSIRVVESATGGAFVNNRVRTSTATSTYAANRCPRPHLAGESHMLPEDVRARRRVRKQDSDARPVMMYINVVSEQLSRMELTDYTDRFIADRFLGHSRGSPTRASSGARPAMRVWIDRLALAARNLTVNDIEAALRRREHRTAGWPYREQRPRTHRAHRPRLRERSGLSGTGHRDAAEDGPPRASWRSGDRRTCVPGPPLDLPRQRVADGQHRHHQAVHRQYARDAGAGQGGDRPTSTRTCPSTSNCRPVRTTRCSSGKRSTACTARSPSRPSSLAS